ncbi:MAG: LysR family transcriptional regulator [Verrucomicrobia bacterium]|nr:LysR family transcriptional regulator [Verrucomicrobiota bacterium]
MNRPTVHELECFQATAEELNFSRAAKRLNLSQPALSRQIRSLEDKLGVHLLVRSTRRVTLTNAGALYLEDARTLLTRLDHATDAARRTSKGETTRLRLAFVGALLDDRLIRVLRDFRRSHVRCQVHLTDLPPARQLEALRAGELDGGFVGAPPDRIDPGLRTVLWRSEPLVLALPVAHRFAREKSVRLANVRDDGWVMVSRDAAPAFRRQFDRFCASEKFRARIVHESERVSAVLTMVAAEQGISLLPKGVSRLIANGVRFVALAGRTARLDHTFAFAAGRPPPEIEDLVALLSRPDPPCPRQRPRSTITD